MKLDVGQSAEVSRRFPASDAAVFAGLAGLDRLPEAVPQPLIGGLFSYLLGVRLPGFGTNYLKQEMSFLSEARFGEMLSARVTITRLGSYRTDLSRELNFASASAISISI